MLQPKSFLEPPRSNMSLPLTFPWQSQSLGHARLLLSAVMEVEENQTVVSTTAREERQSSPVRVQKSLTSNDVTGRELEVRGKGLVALAAQQGLGDGWVGAGWEKQ